MIALKFSVRQDDKNQNGFWVGFKKQAGIKTKLLLGTAAIVAPVTGAAVAADRLTRDPDEAYYKALHGAKRSDARS